MELDFLPQDIAQLRMLVTQKSPVESLQVTLVEGAVVDGTGASFCAGDMVPQGRISALLRFPMYNSGLQPIENSILACIGETSDPESWERVIFLHTESNIKTTVH